MEIQLHDKYINVEFSSEQVSMFTDIVEEDLAMKRILLTIAQHADAHKNESDLNSGISIKQLSEKVIIKRKVQKDGKSKKYTISETNIDRKHVERIVDSLSNMTLCYFKSFHPTKVIFLTPRGRSIATELIRRQIAKPIPSSKE
ncbi:hypothetical protein [Paenibacillus tepidiphilus]|uniref:hypothetical protein n=1 Tax=Paenibacillus tepidiphilus TaxID=2608683 RepID=UPI00123C32C7|nr:hypothetical protein [Paenibacillus tepidiphilus]